MPNSPPVPAPFRCFLGVLECVADEEELIGLVAAFLLQPDVQHAVCYLGRAIRAIQAQMAVAGYLSEYSKALQTDITLPERGRMQRTHNRLVNFEDNLARRLSVPAPCGKLSLEMEMILVAVIEHSQKTTARWMEQISEAFRLLTVTSEQRREEER